MEKTLHEEALDCICKTTNALVSAIKADIKDLYEKNGNYPVVFECMEVDVFGNDNEYECKATYLPDDDSISFELGDSVIDIDGMDLGTLIDIQNALLCDRYYVEKDDEELLN